MKDYSQGRDCNFILNYEIIDDTIMVKYNTNDYMSYPYTKEKEQEILNTMKMQVKRYVERYIYEQAKNLDSATKCLIFNGLLLGINFLISISGLGVNPLLNAVCYLTTGVGVLYSLVFRKVSLRNLEDADKNKLYVAREEMLEANNQSLNNILSLNDLSKVSFDELSALITKNSQEILTIEEAKNDEVLDKYIKDIKDLMKEITKVNYPDMQEDLNSLYTLADEYLKEKEKHNSTSQVLPFSTDTTLWNRFFQIKRKVLNNMALYLDSQKNREPLNEIVNRKRKYGRSNL